MEGRQIEVGEEGGQRWGSGGMIEGEGGIERDRYREIKIKR